MQIYAFDRKASLVSASEAIRHRDYFCLGCQAVVRLRGGKWRQLHFYHLDFHRKQCSIKKSLIHLHIQYTLQKLIAPQEVVLERHYSEIGRIADVVWPAKRLIFEVQCSPISAKEVEARNKDYQKIGYWIVWILHDRQFNHFKLTSAEYYLRPFPHYFTNINVAGKGLIYDQYAHIQGGKRVKRSHYFPINIKYLTYLNYNNNSKDEYKQIVRQLPQERQKWPLCFKGDLFHQPFPIQPWKKTKCSMPFIRWSLCLYRFFFRLLLEKTCR